MSSGSSKRDEEEGRHINRNEEKKSITRIKTTSSPERYWQGCADCPRRIQRLQQNAR